MWLKLLVYIVSPRTCICITNEDVWDEWRRQCRGNFHLHPRDDLIRKEIVVKWTRTGPRVISNGYNANKPARSIKIIRRKFSFEIFTRSTIQEEASNWWVSAHHPRSKERTKHGCPKAVRNLYRTLPFARIYVFSRKKSEWWKKKISRFAKPKMNSIKIFFAFLACLTLCAIQISLPLPSSCSNTHSSAKKMLSSEF